MERFLKITPVLLAEDVEACAAFWSGLGFETTMTVPFGEGLGFAALSADGIEVMYQSFDLARAQDKTLIEGVGRSVIYIEVASLADLEARIDEHSIAVPARMTDYGAREIYVRDPSGNLIGFAEQVGRDG
ncbi:VOC family protein [Parvularcula maris]|uniref:VOC family protein n=1 Tax=Parvularcula maris TaxID=2965077 RepID=A0A9X2L911_9PROT|nr:VOC family protein [Parvularcula maris]MCQ8185333.1 VOC family protein [Parvularcula maris]